MLTQSREIGGYDTEPRSTARLEPQTGLSCLTLRQSFSCHMYSYNVVQCIETF